MERDDDDDDEKAANVTRYPVMPSLASLRLMRNRLHLANLGKKLMKWTSISSGRELRKIAGKLIDVYATFSADMIEAYIKLARSRYFYPTLNERVIEHCPAKAKLTINKGVKTGAGVKLSILIVQDSDIDGYEYLGIEKGGQCIKETKEAWERLLKKIILILQYKTSFLQVEAAHKNATKKVNVLQRVQIPKICMTVRYILTELDEQEREEMFRLKRFKEKKNKKKAPAEVKIVFDETDTIKKKVKPIEIIPEVIEPEVQTKPIIIKVPVEVKKSEPNICVPCEKSSNIEKVESDKKINQLKKQLQEIIVLSRNFLDKGFKNVNVKKFVTTCNEAQQKIDQLVQQQCPSSQIDKELKSRLEHLKRHLCEVINATRDFCEESPTTFDNPCGNVHNEKKPCYLQEAIPKTCIGTESRMDELKNHIDDIVNLIEDYKEEGLLSESVEAFLASCDHVKSKINIYAKEIDEARNQKAELLGKQVTFVNGSAESMHKGVKDLLCSCKNSEIKLDECKEKDQNSPANDGLAKLVTQINKTKELSQEAKKKGFESENLEKFLKSCDDIKTHIESKYVKEVDEQPKCLKRLKHNIHDVMKLVSKCRAEGSLSESAEAFIRSCEKTNKDVLGKHSKNNDEMSTESCTCHSEKSSEEILCGNCVGEIRIEPGTKHLEPPTCDYCNSSICDMLSETMMCDTCLQDPFNEVDWLSYVSAKLSEENTCDLCKNSTKEDIDMDHHDLLPEGAYLQIVTKIERTHHLDGSVREVKETITIKNDDNKHIASFIDSDQDEHGPNCAHVQFGGEKKVNTCITPNENQCGFTRCVKNVKSEKITGNAPMATPYSRQCISMDNLTCMNNNMQTLDNLLNETKDSIIEYTESSSKTSKTVWKNKP